MTTELLLKTGQEVRAGLADPEVRPKARRRRFTSEYKLRIVGEAAEAEGRGDVGALLRREGLYSSLLTTWRREAKAGSLRALNKKRGRKKSKGTPEQQELKELRRENSRLKRRLERAETVIGVQKKLSEMLGITLDPPELPDDIENE